MGLPGRQQEVGGVAWTGAENGLETVRSLDN